MSSKKVKNAAASANVGKKSPKKNAKKITIDLGQKKDDKSTAGSLKKGTTVPLKSILKNGSKNLVPMKRKQNSGEEEEVPNLSVQVKKAKKSTNVDYVGDCRGKAARGKAKEGTKNTKVQNSGKVPGKAKLESSVEVVDITKLPSPEKSMVSYTIDPGHLPNYSQQQAQIDRMAEFHQSRIFTRTIPCIKFNLIFSEREC